MSDDATGAMVDLLSRPTGGTDRQTDAATQAQTKAAVLREALPWITRFRGATVVIKVGGNAMVEPRITRSFAADVALLHVVGLRPVIVHGGGPQIDAIASRLGLEARFVGGLRVTDDATMEVVRMVLLGQVNPELVGAVHAAGGRAVGVAGTDAGLLTVTGVRGPGGEELGRVGEVSAVDPLVITRLLDDGFIPVVATVGRDAHGVDHNVNADTAAGAIAAALGAAKLVYLTDVAGLYQGWTAAEPPAGSGGWREDLGNERTGGSLLSEIGVARLEGMLAADEIQAGMRPKAASIVTALRAGVPRAHILDGRVTHAVLLEIFTDAGVGTMITAAGSGGGAVADRVGREKDRSDGESATGVVT